MSIKFTKKSESAQNVPNFFDNTDPYKDAKVFQIGVPS